METARPAHAADPPPPRPRAVLLGASNLSNGLPAAVAAARRALGGGPIDALAAAGHGRSYGAWSRAGIRGLPGILDCGLWRELERRDPAGPPATAALITDVGNDVGYGERPETIAGWVDECARRLAEAGAATVVSRLPLATLERLPRWRFRVVATLLFPSRRLDFDTVLARAGELDRRLEDLADRRGFRLAALEPEWFRGWDAIHLRLRHMGTAWGALLGAPDDDADAPTSSPAPAERLRIHLALPERFTLAGAELRTAQPAARLGDGTTVSVF